MKICKAITEMRAGLRTARSAGKRLGLVATMGALHEGHLSLVRASRAKADMVTVSIFVNPRQFGPNEDFLKYPRTFERDCTLLEKEGVELVFAPSVEGMYPKGAVTYVTVEGLSEKLCGRSRPGHFRGVTTVVSKLFHIVEPDLAFFGQKDAAQVAIIRRMVRDLNMPVEIVVCPIESLLVAGTAIQALIQSLLSRGRVDLPAEQMMTFAEVKKVLGLDDVTSLRARLTGDRGAAK